MCQLCPNPSKEMFCVDCLKQADRKAATEMHISTDELCQGVLVACDGGSLNNQSSNRYGYGSFRVFMNGDLRFSTYNNKELMTHVFDYGKGVTNNVAECKTILHALTYIDELIARGYKDIIRLGVDSQTALLAATTDIKKPAKHLKALYQQIRELALKLRNQVQFVKIAEQDMKGLLGH
jgi:ribonuclease HI